jgi:hypothetical protein
MFDYYSLIWPSAYLYREAVACLDDETFLAACILCRAAMEALLHIAKTRDGFRVTVDPKTRLSDLLGWAEKQGLLDGLVTQAWNIHDQGDYVAHLPQKLDADYKKVYDKFQREMKKSGSDSGSIIPLPTNRESPWISEEIANKVVNDTCSILIQVSRKRWKGKPLTTFSPMDEINSRPE